jgi:hypothetical protein
MRCALQPSRTRRRHSHYGVSDFILFDQGWWLLSTINSGLFLSERVVRLNKISPTVLYAQHLLISITEPYLDFLGSSRSVRAALGKCQ